MADMANLEQIQKAWDYLKEHTNKKIIPITYINCTAELKAFVGKNGGCICTSSNAEKVVQWALENGDMVFFFPDQHLGRNTAHDLGIGLDEMNIYHPGHQFGGLEKSKIDSTKVLLWYGYCSVHQGFSLDQIKNIRRTNPKGKIIVHPECSFDVVQNSDDAGSTAYIIDQVKKAKAGEELYIGTEINLVNRLAHEHPHLSIKSLSPYQCLCTTMYRVRPRWLLNSLLSIKKEEPINIIRVNSEVTEYALMALDKMFEIS
jgi:quinolinate synthase